MAKIKIKLNLENKTDKTCYTNEVLGIKFGNKFKYNDNNVKTIITIQNSDLIIERSTNEYTLYLHLSIDNITNGYYNIKSTGIIDISIETSKLIFKNNEIFVEYSLNFEREKLEYTFLLKWEEII